MDDKFLIFLLDDQPYALPLPAVERVVRAVAVTRLPSAPASVAGVINVQGRVIPVISLRSCFDLPERRMMLSDQMVIVQTANRQLALITDEVIGVVECLEDTLVKRGDQLPETGSLRGVMKHKTGIVLIADIEALLSQDEEADLAEAYE